MEYWIELVMKYKEIIKDITDIKKERKEFIDTFDTNKNLIYKSLMSAVENKNLNSIRVHKYLTSNKKLGKVVTARYLESINLNENTKIKFLQELKNNNKVSFNLKLIE